MNKILITIITIIIALVLKNILVIIIPAVIYIFYVLIQQANELSERKKQKQNIQADFHLYLKNVILLLYSRPLKQAFIDANYIKNDMLKIKIDTFIEKQKFDYTINPYIDLALAINDDTEFVNYEINIMQLLFEMNKTGIGEEYIIDLMHEIDLLIENQMALEIQQLNDNSYTYTLPPTIINFVYVSFVLFKVIDMMIMSVLG